MEDDVILTPAPPTRNANASLTWNDGGGGIQPSLRTRYQEKETLDFDEPDSESLPATEAAPGGKKRRYAKKKRAAPRRRRQPITQGGGGVSKRRTKRKKGGRRRRPKGYTVRKGKIKIYSSLLGTPRMFSASKILSKIAPSTIESAANLVVRGGRRRRPKKKR